MRKSKIIPTTAAIAAAGALALTGAASPAGAAATAKNEQFTMITTNPGSGAASVIATGRFTAGGTAVNIKHGQTFHFANGDFTIAIGKHGRKHQNLNLSSCLFTKTGSSTYTFEHGTGAYRGITGSGKVSFTLRAAYPLINGKCPSTDLPGTSGNPTAIQFTETASGPVTLP
jgi:hypothetical protein